MNTRKMMGRSAGRGRLALLISAMMILAVSGCGSDDSPVDPGPGTGGTTGNGQFSATIDGVAWTSDVTIAVNSSGVIAISGASVNGETGMAFGFLSTGTGVYPIGANLFSLAVMTGPGGAEWSAAEGVGSGSTTVTTLTATRIAGTFNFVMEAEGTTTPAQRVVTGGTFDLTLETQ